MPLRRTTPRSQQSALEAQTRAAQKNLISGPKLLPAPIAGRHLDRATLAKDARAEFALVIADAVLAIFLPDMRVTARHGSVGLIAGLGETDAEMRAAIADLRNVGVEVLTVGQYLRPSPAHAPVVRWWTPAEFDAWRAYALDLGFAHVECGPLVRSSYHAKRAVETATAPPVPAVTA